MWLNNDFLSRVSAWPGKIADSLVIEIVSLAGFVAVILRVIWG